MKPTDIKMLKNSLNYGLIMGGILIVFSLLMYILELDMFSVGYAAINFVLTVIIIALIQIRGTGSFRKKHMNDLMSYGYAFLSGLFMGVVASVIIAVYSHIFYNFFDPEYLANNINDYAIMLEENAQITDEMYDRIMARMDKYKNENMWRSALFGTIVFAGIISLITAAFTRKKGDIPKTDVI